MGRDLADDSGVSEVVGEMLMIALVIVLLSVFSAALYNYLPTERDPSITVMMTNDTQKITIWHKGGDWVKVEDLSVVIGTGDTSRRIPWDNQNFTLVPKKDVFDLGSNITIRTSQDLLGNESIKLVSPHTVIYTGRIDP